MRLCSVEKAFYKSLSRHTHPEVFIIVVTDLKDTRSLTLRSASVFPLSLFILDNPSFRRWKVASRFDGKAEQGVLAGMCDDVTQSS